MFQIGSGLLSPDIRFRINSNIVRLNDTNPIQVKYEKSYKKLKRAKSNTSKRVNLLIQKYNDHVFYFLFLLLFCIHFLCKRSRTEVL